MVGIVSKSRRGFWSSGHRQVLNTPDPWIDSFVHLKPGGLGLEHSQKPFTSAPSPPVLQMLGLQSWVFHLRAHMCRALRYYKTNADE